MLHAELQDCPSAIGRRIPCNAAIIMDLWAYQRGVILDFSRPGKPTDNAFIEAFNSKLRSECLNAHWFLSLQDACEKLEAWRGHYNEERPHSAIGNIPRYGWQTQPVQPAHRM